MAKNCRDYILMLIREKKYNFKEVERIVVLMKFCIIITKIKNIYRA